MANFEEISLSSQYFEGVPTMVDTQMQRTIRRMLKTASDEGTVTLKIKIKLKTTDDGEIVPIIDCDITGTIQLKEGTTVGTGAGYDNTTIAVRDGVPVLEIGGRQVSMFEAGGDAE